MRDLHLWLVGTRRRRSWTLFVTICFVGMAVGWPPPELGNWWRLGLMIFTQVLVGWFHLLGFLEGLHADAIFRAEVAHGTR